MRRRALLGALLMLATAHADENSPDRVRTFAQLPDWRGYWDSALMRASASPSGRPDDISGNALRQNIQLMGHPPYNAEWERRYQQRLAASAQRQQASKLCDWRAFPLTMEAPTTFQVVIVPEEVLMVFDKGAVRHIHTDGRKHPASDDLWPTRMGHSIGRWEGDTLIVDTIATLGGPVASGPSGELSDQAHYVERFRRIDADTLENRMTIVDPVALTKPWELTIQYKRSRHLDRMIEWDCDEDINVLVDDKLTVVPP